MGLQNTDLNELFGEDTAESEDARRRTEYYLPTGLENRLAQSGRLAILVGNKGIGKTTLFQTAMDADRNGGWLPILIRPLDINAIAQAPENHVGLVQTWVKGLEEVLPARAVAELGRFEKGKISALLRAGSRVVDVVLQGVKSDALSFDPDPAKKALLDTFLENKKISIYVDELDEGWTGTRQEVARIAALLHAVRSLANENDNLRFRVALRTDIYNRVKLVDGSADKYDSKTIRLSWTNHQVFVLLLKRVATFDKKLLSYPDLLSAHGSQRTLARHFDAYMDPVFYGTGSWRKAPTYQVLMSFARKRPRDLIKLVKFAALEAQSRGAEKIQTKDLQQVFPRFSDDRLADVSKEFESELSNLRGLLLALKPTADDKRAPRANTLDTSQMLRRLENARSNSSSAFANGDPVTPQALLAFLYRIDFLQATKLVNETLERVYYDEVPHLTPDQMDAGYQWETHIAFRWALQPDQRDRIFIQSPFAYASS